MAGANSLELTVKGKEEVIRKALDMVENIEELVYHQSMIKDACDFTVKIAGNQDMRENIFFALAEVKCPILKMQSSNMSLEEVFLKLTDDGRSISSEVDEMFEADTSENLAEDSDAESGKEEEK